MPNLRYGVVRELAVLAALQRAGAVLDARHDTARALVRVRVPLVQDR